MSECLAPQSGRSVGPRLENRGLLVMALDGVCDTNSLDLMAS
jgi:hypothetical protein